MAFQGPEYLLRALPYNATEILEGNKANGPQAWELETALAIVEEAVNTLDAPALQSGVCELVWPEGCGEFGRSTLLYQTFHTPSMRLVRPAEPECDRTGPSRPTPDTNFSLWLKLRKYEWSAGRMQREGSCAPPLESDFYGWLSARKAMWRMQRAGRQRAHAHDERR